MYCKMQPPRSELIIGFIMILASFGMIMWSPPSLTIPTPEINITITYNTVDQLRITFSMDELHQAAQHTACTLLSVRVPPTIRATLIEKIVENRRACQKGVCVAIRFHLLPNATDYCPPLILSGHVIE